MSLFIQTTSQREFNEKLKLELAKLKKENELNHMYYEGKHWLVGGIVTMAGVPAVDKRKKDKTYHGVTMNIIKDCVDTIKNLTAGVDGINSNISDVLSVNFENLHDEIVEDILVYGNAYIKLVKGFDNNIGLVSLDNNKVIHLFSEIEDESGNIFKYDEFAIVECKGNYAKYEDPKYIVTIYSIDFIRVYDDGILISETPNELGFVPIFQIEGFDSYVEDLIPSQDMLNIALTQEFEINKYAGDPLTVITGMAGTADMYGKEVTADSIKIGAGEIVLVGEGSDVKRIDSAGVTQEFLDAMTRYQKSIYKIGKLGSLKNDDLNGVTSGYALQLKLIETTSFVRKLRNTIKEGFKDMFDTLSKSFGVMPEITYSDVVPMSQLDKIAEAKGYKELGLSNEFIMAKLGLTEDEIKKELSTSIKNGQ